MDVCLVLSHRCNLACTYCYAGEHHKTDMDEATLDRAVDLLYSDGAEVAELSFFGGEPFLAFAPMQRAVARASAAAALPGRRLVIQCTTNGAALKDDHVAFVRASGMRTTVSIDGVKEAHDLQRPRAGGGSSWDQVVRGLAALEAAGCRPDAMMVISPDTVPHVYRSVSWLWSQGISTVRANLVLDAPWTNHDRAELREQTFAVASELVARRGRGQQVSFEPLGPAIRRALAAAGGRVPPPPTRKQIVVAPSGHLYPCAPLVGEDKDSGREAALRLGHLRDTPAAIASRVTCDGAGCDDGRGCACAAYLETGDRQTAGPNALWWAALCDELGSQAGAAIARMPRLLAPVARRPSRRPFIVGLAAALGGLSIGVPALLGLQRREPTARSCRPPGFARPPTADLGAAPLPGPSLFQSEPEVRPVPGQMLLPPEPELTVDGEFAAPPGAQRPGEPANDIRTGGELAAPPGPELGSKGDIGIPGEPAAPSVRGELRAVD